MFPYLSDLTNYLFGFSFSFPLPMFGFMVALAFIAANYLFVKEMKRKEEEGLLAPSTIEVIKGAKASISDLLSNGVFGFVLGFKIVGVIVNYSAIITPNNGIDLPSFILSLKGNFFGGVAIAAILVYLKYREAEKQRLPEPKTVKQIMHPYQHVGNMTLIAAVGGILGAKLFDAIEDMDRLLAHPIDVIFSGSGLSIYGGLIIGGGAVVYYAYKKGLKLVHVVDACAPGLMLAYGIGRIGCQLAGDGDWGVPNISDKPHFLSFLPNWMWSFNYPGNVSGVDLGSIGHAIRLDGYLYEGNAWPTPFYETVMAIIIFTILWSFRKKIKVAGVMFSTYLILNGIERFFIEKIRINPQYLVFGFEVSQAQIIAILLIIAGIFGIWYANKVKKSTSS